MRTATRSVAVGMALIGGIITLVNLPLLLPGATTEFNGVAADDMLLRVFSVALPLVGSVLGVLMYRAHPPCKD